MKYRPTLLALLLAAVIFGVASPAFADRRADAKAQVEFGWDVAIKGLWNEAAYRWEKAVELDPSYAAAWNNLGIAYEHEGKFDQARKARKGPADRSEQQLHPSELRSVQGNL